MEAWIRASSDEPGADSKTWDVAAIAGVEGSAGLGDSAESIERDCYRPIADILGVREVPLHRHRGRRKTLLPQVPVGLRPMAFEKA